MAETGGLGFSVLDCWDNNEERELKKQRFIY